MSFRRWIQYINVCKQKSPFGGTTVSPSCVLNQIMWRVISFLFSGITPLWSRDASPACSSSPACLLSSCGLGDSSQESGWVSHHNITMKYCLWCGVAVGHMSCWIIIFCFDSSECVVCQTGPALLSLMGIRFEGLIPAIILPLMLTMVRSRTQLDSGLTLLEF